MTEIQAELRRWVQAFPAKGVDREINDLTEQRSVIDAKISELTQAREDHRRWAHLLSLDASGGSGDSVSELETPPPAVSALNKRPPKRQAAMRLLAERPGEFVDIAVIAERLRERGEMGTSGPEFNALRVALYKAFQRGDLERRGKTEYAFFAVGRLEAESAGEIAAE